MEPTVAIRRAAAADADALARLAVAAYTPYLERMPDGLRPAPMDADYAAAIAHDEVWVAELGERIVGLLVLVPHADHLLLENVAVHPELHGRGVGRRLLDLADARAVALGMPSIRLFTHATMTENQRIYAARGYTRLDRRDEDGFDRVFFAKAIGPAPAT